MTRVQQTQLFGTKVLGSAMFTVSAINLGFTLGAGLTAGPIGWIALGFCGITLAGLAETKGKKPYENLFDYEPVRHRNITTSIYNMFSSIGRLGGFYNTEDFPLSSSPKCTNTRIVSPRTHSETDTESSTSSLTPHQSPASSQRSTR